LLFSVSRISAGWTEKRITRFFILRGLLLIILQLTLENTAWLVGMLSGGLETMKPPGGGDAVMLHFGVLYGLGGNMILFAFLRRLKVWIILVLSLTAILVTQWFTPGTAESGILYHPLLRILFIPGQTGIWQSFYPVFPWLGITGLGILAGMYLRKEREKAFSFFLLAGVTCLALFILLRGLNGFGNFHVWRGTVISFLNVNKYPPSLSFISLTLGINLILLYIFQQGKMYLPKMGKPLIAFGQVALFFYIGHLYIYAAIGLLFKTGVSYALTYGIWFLSLLILYPLCVWFGVFKRSKPLESVWRFFKSVPDNPGYRAVLIKTF